MMHKFFYLLVPFVLVSVLAACESDAEKYARTERNKKAHYEHLEKVEANRVREESVDRQNKEIDNAQDDLLNDYKKKSVKHYVSAGAGARVDSFTMKNGKVIICKTTVSDFGKAVDCN